MVVDAAAGLLRLCHAPGPQRQTHRPHPSGVSLPVSGPAPAGLAEIRRIRDGMLLSFFSAGLWHDVAGSAGRNASDMKKKRTGTKPFRLSLSFSMSLLPLLGKSSFLGWGHLPLLAGNRSAIAAGRIRPLTASMLRTSSVMHLPAEISPPPCCPGRRFSPEGCCSGCLPKYFSPFWGRMRHSGV